MICLSLAPTISVAKIYHLIILHINKHAVLEFIQLYLEQTEGLLSQPVDEILVQLDEVE